MLNEAIPNQTMKSLKSTVRENYNPTETHNNYQHEEFTLKKPSSKNSSMMGLNNNYYNQNDSGTGTVDISQSRNDLPISGDLMYSGPLNTLHNTSSKDSVTKASQIDHLFNKRPIQLNSGKKDFDYLLIGKNIEKTKEEPEQPQSSMVPIEF